MSCIDDYKSKMGPKPVEVNSPFYDYGKCVDDDSDGMAEWEKDWKGRMRFRDQVENGYSNVNMGVNDYIEFESADRNAGKRSTPKRFR